MRRDHSASKAKLRQQCRDIRNAMSEESRREASRMICEHIETWTPFIAAQTVLSYLPMRAEVDLRPLLERCPSKRWGLPRILPQGGMVFHVYDSGSLVRHPFGMLEPHPDLPVILPQEAQVVLVPGLAYDRQGWRLGYGGGFYDRFLPGFGGAALGVTYDALLLDHLPHGRGDVPLRQIVTEQGILIIISIVG